MNREIHGRMRGGGAAASGRAVRLISALVVLFAAGSAWGGGRPESESQGSAGEEIPVPLGEDTELTDRTIIVMVAKTEQSDGALYVVQNLAIPLAPSAKMDKAGHLVVANLQVCVVTKSGRREKIGNFIESTGGPLTVRIPYPKELHSDPPVLYFWVAKRGAKEPVALHRADLGDYGVLIAERRAETDGGNRILVLKVIRWPVNDIIISWDG